MSILQMLQCGHCKITKSTDLFSLNKKNATGYQTDCNACRTLARQCDWQKIILKAALSIDDKLSVHAAIPIDLQWIEHALVEQHGNCRWCTAQLLYGPGIDRKQTDSIYISRLNQEQPHHKSNCVLTCYRCYNLVQWMYRDGGVIHRGVPLEIMEQHGPNLKNSLLKYCGGPTHESDDTRVLTPDNFGNSKKTSDGLYEVCKPCVQFKHQQVRGPPNQCIYCGSKALILVCSSEVCRKKQRAEQNRIANENKKRKRGEEQAILEKAKENVKTQVK